MSDDLLTNLVAFELRREGRIDRVVGRGQTKASESVRVAWLEVQQEHHAGEGEVRRIYSEWELSANDQRFVAARFLDAELTYPFARPADDTWDAAPEDARRSTEAAAARQALDAAKTTKGRALLPVLRDDGQRCFVVEREGDFAAAAIGLPDFAEQAAGWAGERQLIVGLPNPDTLMVCVANSPMARRGEEIAFASDYQGAVNLTPCVLLSPEPVRCAIGMARRNGNSATPPAGSSSAPPRPSARATGAAGWGRATRSPAGRSRRAGRA